jgi:glycosyltransferase involved in cell wall biosynthesis
MRESPSEMKVALVGLEGDFSPSTGGGVQRYIFELYKNLSSLISIEKIEFRQIKYIGNGLSFGLQTFFKNFSKYEIVHNLTSLLFLKPKFMLDTILITTAHDFQPILYPEFTFGRRVTLKDRLWLQLVVKPSLRSTLSSDYIIANSTQTKEEAIKLGFDKRKIFVVNLGVNRRFFKNKSKKQKRKTNFVVGYLGSMMKRKNLEFAIKAFNTLQDKKIQFDIWGKKEWEFEHLLKIIENKNINFKGFAPEEKIVEVYDSFNIFIFPSFHEGFGLPILEAQARGLPVIIYKYGKIPKEVRKYCFEAEDPEHMAQIIMQLKENGYNEKLQKKAIAYARSFTWKKTARETLEVYKKVFGE